MDDLKVTEREKYERVWRHDEYRKQADGSPVVDRAFTLMGCEPGQSLLDWGCGSGLPAMEFKRRGLIVTGFDIASNCLNEGVDIPLIVGNMWDPPEELPETDYAFCTDVLEHLPPEYVEEALGAIWSSTRTAAYIQVDTVLDLSGPRMNPPTRLHLTVWNAERWLRSIKKFWDVVEPQDGSWSRVGFLCSD